MKVFVLVIGAIISVVLGALSTAIPVAAETSGFAVTATESGSNTPSVFSQVTAWVFEQQRLFQREMSQSLRNLSESGNVAAHWGLILMSFLYGLLHAAGPGHGKVILATYLITHRERVMRGIWLAVMAAACQAASAILLVYSLTWLAGWMPREASAAAIWSERASYALVIFVGALLTARAVRRLNVRVPPRVSQQTISTYAKGPAPQVVAASLHNDNDQYQHAHDCSCGHAHAPSASQLEGATGLRATLSLILSIGLRPCSGAVLVLVFSSIMGIAWAGVMAVLAMAAGTALAVASIALLTVYARQWAVSIAGIQPKRSGQVGAIAGLVGGIAIIAIGFSLIFNSFTPSHPLGIA